MYKSARMAFFVILFASVNTPIACSQSVEEPTGVLNAGFVCLDGVFNSELMAPYDILQHTVYRDSANYIRCFIVTPDGKPFTTFEGIHITPDYSFATAPPIDILVIPSTETSRTGDLQNTKLMRWLQETVTRASHVISVCWGAFPLAATGALDGHMATTFPPDRDDFQLKFPKIKVNKTVNFVADGKFITSAGGALSYEPALYLVEKLYSVETARSIASGLVLDWNLKKVPHEILK
ncbi:MAG: DJ-1/PfpI family protein [bacterium]